MSPPTTSDSPSTARGCVFRPLLAFAASLASATVLSVCAIGGCSIGVACSYGLADRPVLQATTHLIPAVAVFELAACAVLITDRRRAPRRLYKKFVLAGMTLCVLIFFCAAVQWRVGFQQYGSALADHTRRGVVLLGHATWTAVLAALLEALREDAVAAAEAALSAAGDDHEAARWADEKKNAVAPTTTVVDEKTSVEIVAPVPVAAPATAVPMPDPVRVPSPVEV